jgi:hypothetical protein
MALELNNLARDVNFIKSARGAMLLKHTLDDLSGLVAAASASMRGIDLATGSGGGGGSSTANGNC